MYQIEFDREARKALKKIPLHDQILIIRKIEALSKNPKPNGIIALQGKLAGYYRFRSGNYRVIYEIFDEKLVVLIVKIGHRQGIYE